MRWKNNAKATSIGKGMTDNIILKSAVLHSELKFGGWRTEMLLKVEKLVKMYKIPILGGGGQRIELPSWS